MGVPNPYMQMALAEAQKASLRDEVPVGAVLIDWRTGEIITASGNKTEELSDPTAHAEMLAIRAACHKKNLVRLPDCDLYVTLEPCPMCAAAISFARIRRLYFGAHDEKGGGVENGPRIFSSTSCHHKPEVYGGIGAAESGELLKQFFLGKRIG